MSEQRGGCCNWAVWREVRCCHMAVSLRTWKRRERWAWVLLGVSITAFVFSAYGAVGYWSTSLDFEVLVQRGSLQAAYPDAPMDMEGGGLIFDLDNHFACAWRPEVHRVTMTGPPLVALNVVALPLWPVVAGVGVLAVFVARRVRTIERGGCRQCGYAVAGMAFGSPCPECGRQIEP